MKAYEKPRLVALSLSGNDLLCSGCAVKIKEDKGLQEMIGMLVPGGITDYDQIFATGEGCEIELNITGYCKFTGANVILTS